MIKDALILQKREFERKSKEFYVERDLRITGINSDLIHVAIGPRRAGKSFYLIHLLKDKHIGYVNFDDEFLLKVKNYQEIVDAVNQIYDHPKILLLDEIQNLRDWEVLVNRLQRQGYKLFITGSNSKLLSSELSTYLTGRHLLIRVFPFSFKEFLRSKKHEQLTKSEIKTFLMEYMESGGFPEVIVKEISPKEYLSLLVDSIIQKDIVQRYNIKYSAELKGLFLIIVTNFANLLSLSKLKRLTQINSIHTIKNYLNYLEDAFLIFKVNHFSWKVKQQIMLPKKFYIIDSGIVHSKAFNFSSNYGRLMENLVALQLLRNGEEFYYYKTKEGYEVDFVIKEGSKVKQLIQVTNINNLNELNHREVRALLYAKTELKCDNLLVITWDYEGENEFSWFNKKGKIMFIPLWKWLLRINS